MKLIGMEIERMIPVDQEKRMNVRFALALADPLSDAPFSLQVTVPVSLGPEAAYGSIKSAAFDALHQTLSDLAMNSVADLTEALEKGV